MHENHAKMINMGWKMMERNKQKASKNGKSQKMNEHDINTSWVTCPESKFARQQL